MYDTSWCSIKTVGRIELFLLHSGDYIGLNPERVITDFTHFNNNSTSSETVSQTPHWGDCLHFATARRTSQVLSTQFDSCQLIAQGRCD